jgi:NTE family protein
MSTHKFGVALGGGAARGWAHIGVLRALEEIGIKPDVVAGTSIGALVGGAYATGYLDELEGWVRKLSWQEVLSMLDLRLSGGLIGGKKVIGRLAEGMDGINIEMLETPFGAVATDMETGREVWLREGHVLDAIRASIALPGLFSPVLRDDRWLVDGGLVNPNPVSLCRALGADIVIAVDLTRLPYVRNRKEVRRTSFEMKSVLEQWPQADRMFTLLQSITNKLQVSREDDKAELPSTMEVMIKSLNIMTSRISMSRLAGEPPELLIVPKVADVALMEFHRANETIVQGFKETMRHRTELESMWRFIKDDEGAS